MTHAHVDELDRDRAGRRLRVAAGPAPLRHPRVRRERLRARRRRARSSRSTPSRQLGHEEIYLVLRGRARFTVDGNEHELGPGQLVFVRDPSLRRGAVALTDDTVVLALGGKPGAAHEPSAWEAMFAAVPARARGPWDEAIRMHEEALAEQPDSAPLLYNLACMESRGGRPLDALAASAARRSRSTPKWAEYAAKDSDFDPIRVEPGFPA